MADSPEAIKKSIRLYMGIGGVLFACTILTVLVAVWEPLDMGGHGFDSSDMWLGLTIASFKATLVAAIFMHLNHEKKTIYWIFFGSIFFAFSLYHLTHLGETDYIHDKYFYKTSAEAEPAQLMKIEAETSKGGTTEKTESAAQPASQAPAQPAEVNPFEDEIAPPADR